MSGRARTALLISVLATWAAFVIYVSFHHEPWRDEVRALSIAIEPDHFWEIAPQLHEEGHPIVWYLILRAAWTITGTPVVLKVAAVTIATCAVYLFLFHSPFPLPQRVLFVFGTIPLYEYSVIARNYGIAMLLLFLFATLRRLPRPGPIVNAGILALFANTNAYAAFLAPIVTLAWISVEWARDPSATRGNWRRWAAVLLIVVTGVIISAATASPEPDTPFLNDSDFSASRIARTVTASVLHPARYDSAIIPIGARLLALFLLAGLAVRPGLALAGFASFLSVGVFHDLIYGARLRHQGMLLLVILILYWIALESVSDRHREGWRFRLFRLGCTVAIPLLLCLQIINPRPSRTGYPTSFHRAWADVVAPSSSSERVAELIRSTPELSIAIVTGDPQTYLDSMPYYISNRVYFARQEAFGLYAHHGNGVRYSLSLRDLLSTARRLRSEEKVPVIILIGWIDFENEGHDARRATARFIWDETQLAELEGETRKLAEYRDSLLEEDFEVYILE